MRRIRKTLFLNVKTPDEVLGIIEGFEPIGVERIPLEQSFGRVLGEDILAPEDLPSFHRSSMDGYAVKSRDTFGATESLPTLLNIVGEVKMGEAPSIEVREGETAKIATGGMLPPGADSVVMLEYSSLLDEKTVEISRAVSPKENVIQAGDDYGKGTLILQEGSILRPQDVGALAGFGITHIPVRKRPRIALISTGDEIVPTGQSPGPGQVRDINSYTLAAFCRQGGAETTMVQLCPDRFEELRGAIELGLSFSHAVWISGGSSVGTRDLTLKVLQSFDQMELLFQGISISPGKPTLLARVGSSYVFGLPGHTASTLVVAEIILTAFLARLSGESASRNRWSRSHLEARLSRNVPSVNGREDYIRVKIRYEDGQWVAHPIFGKSGLISTLVEADGLVKVGMNQEGMYEGATVMARIFPTVKGGVF
jgi:molybdopterin molybdotransferase